MAEAIKQHSCPLFVPGTQVGAITHLNCGVCSKYVLNPADQGEKNCLAHNELVIWSREHCNWKN